MGPRPFGRGRHDRRGDTLSHRSASMGPRPFGRGRRILTMHVSGPIEELQWGRDLSVAEGTRRAASSTCWAGFNGAATFRSRKDGCAPKALRPSATLQWGRDLSVAEGYYDIRLLLLWHCFNGAATFRSRKANRSAQQAEQLIASMGPRPFGRGRRMRDVGARVANAASMGPRPFGRGRYYHLNRPVEIRNASMGPRPFGRGRTQV